MASFDIAYNTYIKPNEGGYSNVPQDKGGETYAGIARNYHPSWPGWTYIDFIKRTKGEIARNAKFPDIQHQVDQFYLEWWNSRRYGEIKSQDLANLLFDYNVNSSTTAIKAVQRLVGVPIDGVMGPMTIAAINAADPVKLYNALKEDRRQLYEALIARDPSQEVFRSGWMARLARFPTLTIATTATVGFIIVGLALLGIYYYSNKAMG